MILIAIPNSKRYQQNGYNLDLACFEENRLVVMAWPADDQIFMKDMKRSKLIRNDSTEGLLKFQHKGVLGKPERLFMEKLKIYFSKKLVLFSIFEYRTKRWFIRVVLDNTRTSNIASFKCSYTIC